MNTLYPIIRRKRRPLVEPLIISEPRQETQTQGLQAEPVKLSEPATSAVEITPVVPGSVETTARADARPTVTETALQKTKSNHGAKTSKAVAA